MTSSLLVPLLLLQATAGPPGAARDCDAVAGARSLGLATRGSPGLVTLELGGAPVLGHPFELRVTGGLPGARGLLITGPAVWPRPLPAFGATLFPAGERSFEPFVVGPDGASAPLSVRPRVAPELLGLSFVAQAIVLDPGAQGRVAFTKAAQFCFGAAPPLPAFPVPSLDTSDWPEHVRTGDVNGDGILDIMASTRGVGGATLLEGELLVYLGQGDGLFAPRIVTVIGPADPIWFELGELDGDGELDAVATGSGIAAGDLDGDLEPDLAVTNFNDKLVVLRNRMLR